MTARGLHYTETPPGAVALPVVSAYWGFDVATLPSPDFVHRVWPDGCVSLLVVCFGARAVATVVRGVTRAPHDVPVREGARYRGIRFRPECGGLVLGVDVATLRDQNVDARVLLGDGAAVLGDAVAACGDDDAAVHAVFDAWVVQQGVARSAVQSAARDRVWPVDTAVRRAVDLIIASDGQCLMRDVAADVGVQPRTLQRRFLQLVGLTPKQFAQIRRARGALRRAVADHGTDRVGWSGVAAEAGYADQAHLTRDVAKHTRLSPTRLQDRLETIEHRTLVD